jgi:hypothetical protein
MKSGGVVYVEDLPSFPIRGMVLGLNRNASCLSQLTDLKVIRISLIARLRILR